MKNKISILRPILLLVLTALVCTNCVDHSCGTAITFVNGSSHSIKVELQISDRFNIENFSMESGQKQDIWCTSKGNGLYDADIAMVLVTYDETISILHTANDDNTDLKNMCRKEDYTSRILSKNKFFVYYVFTFDDTDYDYAVAHPYVPESD